MKELQKARDFAIKAHGDQKYSEGKPYVCHLDAVVSTLMHFVGTNAPHLLISGFLHDLLEDTNALKDYNE